MNIYLPLIIVLSIIYFLRTLFSDKQIENKKPPLQKNQNKRPSNFIEHNVIPGKMGKNRWLYPQDELGTLEEGVSDNTKREPYADSQKKLIEDFGYEFHQN